jgi:parallel beta-helix repeat protein
MKCNLILICIVVSLWAIPVAAFATEYHVGQKQAYNTIGAVPWYMLKADDTVYIHPGIYNEKFLISTRGTAQKPIRVIGVLDGNGNRPVIDGQNATTSTNNHHHWQTPNLMQWDGVVFISINSDDAVVPAYIEIKNLEIKNGNMNNSFSAENGSKLAYDGFAAGIYIRSAEHILIENCVIHDNGQGIYSWTGSGIKWWDGLAKDITIRGNYFFNNGLTKSYTEHQTYTESDGVIIEYNHYGPQRTGAWGSHLKDRSAGAIIRYNYFDSAPSGWVIDLVEPQESWNALGKSNKYRQAFVYGNVVINNGNYSPNYFHWNEDHQMGNGRATLAGGKLLFYNNTVLTIANQSDMTHFRYFNTTWGGYECPPASPPGVIDIRNNIFAVLPRTAGKSIPIQQFAYCKNQNFNFGVNWVSPGWVTNTIGSVTGTSNLHSSTDNNPGFVSSSSPYDLHLSSRSDAINKVGTSAPEMTNNYLGVNLTPIAQYVVHQSKEVRAGLTSAGAFEFGSSGSSSSSVH